MTVRMVHLTQPATYRLAGSSTRHAPAVTTTLRAPRRPVRLGQRITVR